MAAGDEPAFTHLRVLVAGGGRLDRASIARPLERAGFAAELEIVEREEDLLAKAAAAPHLVLIFGGGDLEPVRAVTALRSREPDLPCVVVSRSEVTFEEGLECLRRGANDFLTVETIDRLGDVVGRVLHEQRRRTEVEHAIDAKLRLAERAQVLIRAAGEMQGRLALRQSLQRVCEALLQALGASGAAVFARQTEAEELTLWASSGLGEECVQPLYGRLEAVVEELERDKAAAWAGPAGPNGAEAVAGVGEATAACKGLAAAGIWHEETLLGLLVLVCVPFQKLSHDDLSILSGVAGICAPSMVGAMALNDANRRLRQLVALHNIELATAGSIDLRLTLRVLADEILREVGGDAVIVLLLEGGSKELRCAEAMGLRTASLDGVSLRPGQGFAGRVVLSRQPVVVPDLSLDPGADPRLSRLREEGFVSYCGVPMVARGRLQGVLEIWKRTPTRNWRMWSGFLEAAALQGALAVDNGALYHQLERASIDLAAAYDATIEGWARALDLRDRETENHTQRVAEITVRLAQLVGIDESKIKYVRWGALLHDIGKVGIRDGILLKPGPLTPDEWEEMRLHPVHAYELLYPIEFLRPALDIPYCHHEKWDGSGYPRGLRGEEIPQAARLFAVVDVFDALSSDRPYRRAWPKDRVRAYLVEESGKHFDPEAVRAFLSILSSEKWLFSSY